MLRKVLFVMALITISMFCLSGCDKSPGDAESEEEVVVKPMAEYEAEAEAEITEENMNEELENLEKAIEQEISQE